MCKNFENWKCKRDGMECDKVMPKGSYEPYNTMKECKYYNK